MQFSRIIVAAVVCLIGAADMARAQVGEEEKQPRPARVAVLHVGAEGRAGGEGELLGVTLPVAVYERAVEELKVAGADVVVLRFNSADGCLGALPFVELIEKKLIGSFRTVGWIECAESEAGFAAMSLPELCMTKGGKLAAHIKWWGNGNGCPPVEHWLSIGDHVSEVGKRSPAILRSMLVGVPLWQSVSGQERTLFNASADDPRAKSAASCLHSGEGWLQLDAARAESCGISKGVANDREELLRTLRIERVEWVGQEIDDRVQTECARAKSAYSAICRKMADIATTASRARQFHAEDLSKGGLLSCAAAGIHELDALGAQWPGMLDRAEVLQPGGWFRDARAWVELIQPNTAKLSTKVAVLNIGRDPAAATDRNRPQIRSVTFPVSAMVQAADELKAAGADVVVLKFNEGDACGTDAFIGAVERSFLPRFRTVGWVASAIDEGAVPALAMPEVCMTPDGRWGNSICHMWDQKRNEAFAAHAAVTGHRPTDLVRAFIHYSPLSMSVVNGKPEYRTDTRGEVPMTSGWGVALDAEKARKCGVSIGTAGTPAELAAVLGLSNVEWIGADIDSRLQARCDKATRAFDRARELVLGACGSNFELTRHLSDEQSKRAREKRAEAWAEVKRIRAAWPELADQWPTPLLAMLSAGVDWDPTWASVARELGIEEKGAGGK